MHLKGIAKVHIATPIWLKIDYELPAKEAKNIEC